MNDEISDLETRLAALKLRTISPALEPAIVRAASRPSRASVSFFWSAAASGAIAASLMITMLVSQSNGSARSAPSTLLVKVPDGSAPLAVARADLRWGDDLGVTDDPSHP